EATGARGARCGADRGGLRPGSLHRNCTRPGGGRPQPCRAPPRRGARPPAREKEPRLRLRVSEYASGCEPGEEAAGGDKLIHERDLAWLQQADVVVAEVTQPSLGVGYELGRAVALNKRILCLFRPQSGRVLSAMIRGAADGLRFQVWDYEEGEVEAMLDRYFEADPSEEVAASPEPTA
uniref:2'-deoxynucleoside 5'-phosphate N-hydrolase 1 n=1 Tax=Equus caballus TaxID=9796 RepID=A0A9L0RAR5_HORSE